MCSSRYFGERQVIERTRQMKPAPIPADEAERLATLKRYAILNTNRECAFDKITTLTSEIFDVPIALVSMIDADRQWFKSTHGIDIQETPRDLAFCAYTILEDSVSCIRDATLDPRYAEHPSVTGEIGLRFYCGAPLIADDGHRLGTICILDTRPRPEFSEKQCQHMASLASIVVEQLEMRSVTGDVQAEIEGRLQAQHKVAETESQIRALIQHVPTGIALLDMHGNYVASSDSWRAFMAAINTESGTSSISDVLSLRPAWRKAFNDAMVGKTTRNAEDPVQMHDGTIEYLRWETGPWKSEDGEMLGVIASSMLVTRQVEARKAMERQTEMLNAVLENVKDGVIACDAEGDLTIFNRSSRKIHGLDESSPVPRKCNEINEVFEADGVTPVPHNRFPMYEAMSGEWVIDREMAIAPKSLPRRHIIAQAAPLMASDNTLIGAVTSMADITSAKLAERQLRASEAHATHIAYHDTLTGLPSRAHFNRMVEDVDNRLHGRTMAAFFLDLNQFKAVNDLSGHKIGDELLKRTARLLKWIIGDNAFVGRLGGDEFIAFKPVADKEEALQLGRRLAHEISQPFISNGHTVASGVSVGIAMHPDHGDTHEELMRRADVAMYKSKAAGNCEPVMFDPVFELETVMRHTLKHELSNAIENEEMKVYLQPIVDAQTQKIIGAEALARWCHPTRGVIEPNEFIPIAEESGFIVELGDWVLRTAVMAIKPWSELFLSVNLSPVQFKDSILIERVFAALDDTDFDPKRLELEVTEGLLIYDTNAARKVIDTFKSRGIHIVLDDFGTGYSSLAYIQNFPFDKIKIDRSFVADIDRNPQSAAVVQCVVYLATTLGMIVTAEGIETDTHEALLKSIGCHTMQGFKYGRPVPVSEFAMSAFENQPISKAG